MTAKGIHFSEEIEDEIEKAVKKHSKIVHAFFLPADKPPATIELE